MKKLIYIILSFSIAAMIMSCEKDEIDVVALTDFPPGILSISPADNGKVVIGGFDVKVVFVDGSVSPLSSGTITVKDGTGAELTSMSGSLSGTKDSIIVEGSSFGAADLPVGSYSLDISVTDSKSQTANKSTTFEISSLPFAANYDEMFLAGTYNGWGADAMTLIADHTWYLEEMDYDGGEWKLKNCADWCDQDWADPDGDGLVENTTGGGPNSAPSPAGLVNFTFNDNTLRYTIEPTVTFEGEISDLYLLGTFNDFQGSEYQFSQTADNMWELDDILLKPDDKFRFSEGPFFMGRNWGDNEYDGTADEFGTNIVLGDHPSAQGEAFYNFDFNDKTLEYTIEFNRFPSIGIIGSATPGGWDSDTDMNDNGDGTFTLFVSLVDGEAKFRANDSWDTNWGGSDFPTGVATQDGPNIPVVAGSYEVFFDPMTGNYDFKPGIESIGIIGSATPGGWDTDTDMTDNGDGTYSLSVELIDGEAKFRANDAWDINWGGTDWPTGVATLGGPNIPVTAGTYEVLFNQTSGEYEFKSGIESLGLIGSATPGGWDSDTDLRDNGDGSYSMIIGLLDGEVKFRTNDAWDTNWGGSDFPSGTGVPGGDNIAVTKGIYRVDFTVSTLAYSFTPASIGILGSATPGGWDTDTDMAEDAIDAGLVSVTLDLSDGEAKFRAQDDWDFNWGAGDFPSGTGLPGGDNIPVTAGTYTVKFNVHTAAYSFE